MSNIYSAAWMERGRTLVGGLIEELRATGERCPCCGCGVEEAFLRCPECGHRLKRNCPECGKIVKTNWERCPFCSAVLQTTAVSATGG